jgi:hypothetical protein
MWEPRRLTTLLAFTAYYKDSFTLLTDNSENDVLHKDARIILTRI